MFKAILVPTEKVNSDLIAARQQVWLDTYTINEAEDSVALVPAVEAFLPENEVNVFYTVKAEMI